MRFPAAPRALVLGLLTAIFVSVATPVAASYADDEDFYYQSTMFSWNELMRQLDVVKNAETLQGQCVQMRKAKVSMHDTWHSFGQLMDVPGVINGPNSGTYNQMSEIFDQADKKINTFLKENCTPPAQ